MIPRPKPGESEDDLLKFQQEFLANQSQPSVNVIKHTGKRKQEAGGQGDQDEMGKDVVQMEGLPTSAPKIEHHTPPVKKTRFKAQQAETKVGLTLEDDPERRIEERDTHMAAVLTKIIERDTRNASAHTPGLMNQAFPSVFYRGEENTAITDKGKKKSLFAQQFSRMAAKDFGVMVEQEQSKMQEANSSYHTGVSRHQADEDTDQPHLIEGTGLSATFGKDEARKIHQENLDKMASMSADEILTEQKKLLEILDPKIVSFLRSKKSSGEKSSAEMSESMDTQTKEAVNIHKHEEIKIEKSDLPVKPEEDWVHMDNVEYDKLAWMSDLPSPKTDDKQTGKPARFDFQGNIVPADSDIPVHLGLHHHGSEPERAGYTLEELFQLARSTNLQQRVLALNTLANVLKKARSGELVDFVQTPILPAVINAGVVFLLRWALDDNTDVMIGASVSAIFSLLVNTADEKSLERVFSWYQGHVVPSHCSLSVQQGSNSQKSQGVDDDETPQYTDADVLKKDIIMCLVTRMSILQRLRYILDKCRPQSPTVIQILGILTRIARHSQQLAYQIMHCAGLLELVFSEFLPISWNPNGSSQPVRDVYGYPVSAAMKLFRVLCEAGTNMAALLLSKYGLQSRLLRYLVDKDPRNLQLSEVEAYHLQTESFKTWRICLLYGHATNLYIDLFSSLMDKLRTLQHVAVSDSLTPLESDNYVAVLGALEAVLHVVSNRTSQKTAFNNKKDGSSMEVESSEVTAMATINWGHVVDLIHTVTKATEKLVNDIKDYYQFKKCDLQLHTACVNFVTSFYSCWSAVAGGAIDVCLQQIEDICNNLILPCWKSFGFRVILENLSQFSNLLNPAENQNPEIATNLPDLGNSSDMEERMIPVVRSQTPFGFVTAILRQLYRFSQIHKGIQDKVLPEVVNDADFRSYLRKVTHLKTARLHNNHFTKFENILQYFFLKLYSLTEVDNGNTIQMYQCVMLQLLTRLHSGDEYLAHDLLSTVLFSPMFWRHKEEDLTAEALASIQLSDSVHLQSATLEEISVTRSQLIQDARSHLLSIRATYLTAFSHSQLATMHSRNRYLGNPYEIKSFRTSNIGECLFPNDWMYIPLIDLYNKFSSVGADVQSCMSASEVDTVANMLRWIYLLECVHRDVMSTISVTLKISRIMCAFLTGNDLFLDKWVHSYLAALLREYTKPALLDQMNFEEEIPGVASFYDLYMALLQQYEAVSFGDSVFASYVLVPLQQKHNLELRKAIWTENRGIMRTLFMPIKELLIPIDRYLYPEENDVQLLRLYYQGLLSEYVRPKWSPILYLISVHHVNRFMYTQDNRHSKIKRLMLQQVAGLQSNKELQHHLLYYKNYNIESDFGMEFYTELPPLRTKLIESVTDIVT